MSQVLVIRADANSRMGTGHVMRCIALGEAWSKSGGDVVFATACRDAGIRWRLDAEGWRVVDVAAVYPASNDLEMTLGLLNDFAGSAVPNDSGIWLACDGYHFDTTFQRAVRAGGYRLLVVDDYNHLPEYDCDVLVNQNISAPMFTYQYSDSCVRLLGPRYALLRREFCSCVMSAASDSSAQNHILVTLGGSDPDNVTSVVIKGLQKMAASRPMAVRVVLGAMNSHIDSVAALIKECGYEFSLLTDVSDMSSLMRWADVAVSAGGATCWELCYFGVPAVLVTIAENQRDIVTGLAADGAAVSLGDGSRLTPDRVSRQVEQALSSPEMMTNLSEKSRALVDGRGAERVVRQMRGTP